MARISSKDKKDIRDNVFSALLWQGGDIKKTAEWLGTTQAAIKRLIMHSGSDDDNRKVRSKIDSLSAGKRETLEQGMRVVDNYVEAEMLTIMKETSPSFLKNYYRTLLHELIDDDDILEPDTSMWFEFWRLGSN